MSSLDERARRSSGALREAVEEAELRLLDAGLPRGTAASRPALASRVLAFAGAFAVVLLGLGMAIVQLSMFADQSVTTVVEPSPAPPVTAEPPLPSSFAPSPATSAPPSDSTVPAGPVQTQADTEPPLLVITFPAEAQTVESEVVRFAGVTEPGATVTRGKYEADVDTEGNWSLVLVVGEGTSTVTFTATDEAGNGTTASVTLSPEIAVTCPTVSWLVGAFTGSIPTTTNLSGPCPALRKNHRSL